VPVRTIPDRILRLSYIPGVRTVIRLVERAGDNPWLCRIPLTLHEGEGIFAGERGAALDEELQMRLEAFGSREAGAPVRECLSCAAEQFFYVAFIVAAMLKGSTAPAIGLR
jgi:hypothetical protein